MQPLEVKRPSTKDPVIRKFQSVVESRYSLVISPQTSKSTVTEEGKIFYLERYGFLFDAFICDIVGIRPDPDNFSYKLLFAIRDLLKSIYIEGNYCIGDNHLFQILKDKKFISHREGEQGNNNVLSKNGKTILFMVEELLYLGGKISKISFTDERFKSLSHSQWDKSSRWANSPTFEVILTAWDLEEFSRNRRMDLLVSKVREIRRIREEQWFAPYGRATREYDHLLKNNRAEYCLLFRAFMYDEIGLGFCDDETLNSTLLDVLNALKSTIPEGGSLRIAHFKELFGIARASENSLVLTLFYILKDKKLITYKQGKSIDDSFMTEKGWIVLELLQEYLGQN